jgi:hypothetical protein
MSGTTHHPEECPHEKVTLPEVGTVCRFHHTPLPASCWPETLDSITDRHPDGTTTHEIWFVGLDEYGRAVYYDTRNARALTLVPFPHHEFTADVDDDMSVRELKRQTLTHYAPRLGPALTTPIDPPEGALLLIHDQQKAGTFSAPAHGAPSLAEWVATEATDSGWDYLSDRMLELLAMKVNQYDQSRYDAEIFPVDRAKWLLKFGQGTPVDREELEPPA